MKNLRLIALVTAIILIFTLSACTLEIVDAINAEPVNGDFAAYFLDVGQGDSSLIVADGEAMLIDAGVYGAADYIIDFIDELGITELSYVVATHPHSDHIGGLPYVLDAFEVNTFLAPEATHTTKSFEYMLDAIERNDLEITIAEPLDTYTLGGALITVLSPEEKEYEDLNNYSVVLRVDYGDTSFLFTGDAEKGVEDEMLENGRDVGADVLKVGHHGSRTSSSPAFLDAVSPEIAVISCAIDNSYGHPHGVTMENLDKRGISVYQTNSGGTVTIVSDGENIEVVR